MHTYSPLIMQCRASTVRLGSVLCVTLGTLEALKYIIREYVCALLTDGVKRGQMHLMEGLYNHS